MRGATVLLAAVLTMGGASGCASTGTAGEAQEVLGPLCDALATDDPAEASAIFEDQTFHTPLHTLADEVAAVDRTVATRLLEAKFAVETVTRDDARAPGPLVHQRLEDLAIEVRAALTAMGRPAPDC